MTDSSFDDEARDKDAPADDQRKQIGSKLGMGFLVWLMRRFPRRIAYFFAVFPVMYYFFARPEGRRSARHLFDRLGMNGGRLKQWRFALSQIYAFAEIILDNMYLGLFGPQSFTLCEFGTDLFLEQLEKGRGLVLLSAHVGNWHLAVNFLENTHTHVHLVIDDARSEAVRRAMDAAKAQSRHLTLHAADAGPALAFEITAALRRGEVVIIAGDRSREGARRLEVPFLGEKASFPLSPALLAATAGAPVCTALTFRTGMHRYNCYGIGPFEAPPDCPKRDRAAVVVRAFARSLEDFVRQYPTQWFNFYDFWQSPPEDDAD